jgi:dTDP-4-amino-4,6-dideoxygalactose transaminase
MASDSGRPFVPLVVLRAAFAPVREQAMREFEAILDRMDLFLGPNLRAFETEFAAHCEVEYGIGVSNGTDAVFAALKACGVGSGDEVIAPAHTFFATIEAIVHTGATPVLVDVEADCLTIDVEQARAALTPATKAIVPVHLYGHPAEMDPIVELARRRELWVVEDASQAHGARYKGRRCGSLGDVSAFSCYLTKNLGAVGEAGFIGTSNSEIAESVRLLRHHGHVSKFEHRICGYNLRMDEMQAAVLRLKLPGLDEGNRRRREIAATYRSRFAASPVRPLSSSSDAEPVFHVFAIRVPERDALRDWLTEQGIETGIHYLVPAHLQPAMQKSPHRHLTMKVTEQACRELLSLPIYPGLTDEKVDYVANAVLQFFERLR